MNISEWLQIFIPVLTALVSGIAGIIYAFKKLIKSKSRETARRHELCEWCNRANGVLRVITSKDKEGKYTHKIDPNEMEALEKLLKEGNKLSIKNYEGK